MKGFLLIISPKFIFFSYGRAVAEIVERLSLYPFLPRPPSLGGEVWGEGRGGGKEGVTTLVQYAAYPLCFALFSFFS